MAPPYIYILQKSCECNCSILLMALKLKWVQWFIVTLLLLFTHSRNTFFPLSCKIYWDINAFNNIDFQLALAKTFDNFFWQGMVMVRGLFILHLCDIRASCSPFKMCCRITKKHNPLHDLVGEGEQFYYSLWDCCMFMWFGKCSLCVAICLSYITLLYKSFFVLLWWHLTMWIPLLG